MRVAIYARVSTNVQTAEMQIRELNLVAQNSGWVVTEIYQDLGISGASGESERPGLRNLLKDACRKKFDMVAIWSIDRLARSMVQLVKVMAELNAKSIDLFAYKQAIDTSTPAGRMMWQLLGVFAEFEKSIIQERVKAGIENARAKGTRLGRPPISINIEEDILRMRAEGMGILRIGRTLRVGTSQVQRVCKNI